ncbi:MAG: universal stress protein [Bacteroidales bacterium]|nr:universal stress protein [Bacteroidales bacterium]MBN2821304.1 universal stress protein [Bacteroidales bacterium]
MEKQLKIILVPVDFKEPSIRAFKYAVNLSKKLHSKVLLLHIIQTPGILADFFKGKEEMVQLTNSAKDRLTRLLDLLDDETLKNDVSTRVVLGKPYQKIIEVAKEVHARMVILGENHQSNDINQEIGSTVYHVTLKSPSPVLTFKGNVENMNSSIVVPIDLTREMRQQLFSALSYGLNYNSKIHLVSSLIGGIKMRESRIYKKLKRAKQTLTENGVECTLKLFPRSDVPPFRKVIEYAEEINAGMILIMTHEEGYTYDNYIGAFAHHIINKSSIPVLSLTSTATNIDFEGVFKGFIDPAGIMLKK